ncbi:MAG: acyl-CoA dehydrogenase family protein [Candidatus Lambdaproteobacteria bacterium]|nr:acyl-CoA dehydrogenase family protein [Candidatus Lambdaproteobacteria bacterium]
MRTAESSVAQPGSARDKRYDDSGLIAPDCRGMNFYQADRAFRDLLPLYLPADLLAHLQPHLERLGGLAGGRLDELAELADKHPPVIQPRDRFGRDEDWIDYHPAYREMERLAYGEFGIHAMSHRAGVLGWPAPMPTLAKYAFQYLFVQAEFGLMCPVSATDTSAHLIIKFGDEALKARFVPRMLSQDMEQILKGTQFMTEKSGGSDVANFDTVATPSGDHWLLTGEKWFCSHIDGDVVMLLARPEGAPDGSRGLALFAMPRRLADGRRNNYRYVRLKDKLGTRSMATGEIVLEGALAYLVGDQTKGLKQMMDQVNLSRLSHGVRAAAMMRRCLNESVVVARNRVAFDKTLVHLPLMRRQLTKIMLPTEQALSFFLFTASTMDQERAGHAQAGQVLRILTPLLKFRSARDNITVATAAMEVRGGNGFVEDWVNARLVRDAHTGVLWEGTSSINALDVVTRAVRKQKAHQALGSALQRLLAEASAAPAAFRATVGDRVRQAISFAQAVADDETRERHSRTAASALYHATCAALMTWEGARVGAQGGDARRLLLARLLLAHRLSPRDPLALQEDTWEEQAIDLLLRDDPVPLQQAAELVTRA